MPTNARATISLIEDVLSEGVSIKHMAELAGRTLEAAPGFKELSASFNPNAAADRVRQALQTVHRITGERDPVRLNKLHSGHGAGNGALHDSDHYMDDSAPENLLKFYGGGTGELAQILQHHHSTNADPNDTQATIRRAVIGATGRDLLNTPRRRATMHSMIATAHLSDDPRHYQSFAKTADDPPPTPAEIKSQGLARQHDCIGGYLNSLHMTDTDPAALADPSNHAYQEHYTHHDSDFFAFHHSGKPELPPAEPAVTSAINAWVKPSHANMKDAIIHGLKQHLSDAPQLLPLAASHLAKALVDGHDFHERRDDPSADVTSYPANVANKQGIASHHELASHINNAADHARGIHGNHLLAKKVLSDKDMILTPAEHAAATAYAGIDFAKDPAGADIVHGTDNFKNYQTSHRAVMARLTHRLPLAHQPSELGQKPVAETPTHRIYRIDDHKQGTLKCWKPDGQNARYCLTANGRDFLKDHYSASYPWYVVTRRDKAEGAESLHAAYIPSLLDRDPDQAVRNDHNTAPIVGDDFKSLQPLLAKADPLINKHAKRYLPGGDMHKRVMGNQAHPDDQIPEF